MLLQNKQTGTLVEVEDLQALIDPNNSEIIARDQAGQEEQDPEPVQKTYLSFPSGEDLPVCWLDAEYQASL